MRNEAEVQATYMFVVLHKLLRSPTMVPLLDTPIVSQQKLN